MVRQPMHDDYLFVGPKIVQRLRDQMAGLVQPMDVLHIEHLRQAAANIGTRSPVIFVLWDGEGMGSGQREANNGAARIMHQIWTVCLYVRNASQVALDARNLEAGPLMSKIHMALAGWKPGGSIHPMHRTSPGKRPQYPTDSMSAMYPLSFSIDLHY